MIDIFPEMALQSRQNMLNEKFNLIKENSPHLTKIYLRNLFRRHPDLFLKSLGSMKAKVNYFNRTLNRQLAKEKAFPLLLHYNFQHIWSRCEVLRDFGMKNFDVVEVLTTTDADFCKKFGIAKESLKLKKSLKPVREEKDYLWTYTTAGGN